LIDRPTKILYIDHIDLKIVAFIGYKGGIKIWAQSGLFNRYGNKIYLTNERWEHIIENHPEMENYSHRLEETIRTGRRRQEPLDPRKYRYIKYFEDLIDDNNHIAAIAMFKLEVDEKGNTVENSFILTAYQKYIKQKG
jgi:hypothetical protein